MGDGRTTVLVLYGGRSAEHEISILSARFIVSSLDRYRALLVGIAPDGRWYLQGEDDLPTSTDPREASIDDSGDRVWLEPSSALLHVEGRPPIAFDVAFPVLHGPMGEDGTVQGLLELAGVPYVGSGVAASAVGMHKELQKKVLAQSDLPVVPYVALSAREWHERETLEACEALGYPLFVKPANMGSSLGVRKANDRRALFAAVAHALEFDTRVLVEQGLTGARELECSVLGNEEPVASLAGEIVVEHRDGFYSYDAKYIDNGARLSVPAELTPDETAVVQRLAIGAFRAIDGAGMARVDMFLTAEGLYVNEVNTIPGFTAISMYPMLWRASGIEPSELVHRLVLLGLDRHRARSSLRTTR